jgi:septal ring factor EnvC (AmiA/AmiB activator)
MNFRKTTAGALILTLGLSTIIIGPVQAETISELQNQQQSVNSSITQKQSELADNQSAQNDTVAQLAAINDQIHDTETQIQSLTDQISSKQAEIDETASQIAETQKELDAAQSSLSDRVVEIYKNGSVDYLEVLMQSASFTDFLTRFEYLSYITKHDKSIVDTYKNAKAQLESQKAQLESQKAELDSLMSAQEQVRADLSEQQATQQEIYAQLESDESAIRENIAAMQAQSDAIGAQIAQLQAEAARKAEEARRQAEAAAQQGAASAASAAPVATQAAGGGVWPAPASHRITSSYGGRSYPMGGYYDFHLGTDIGAGYGTPVVAYQSGTVLIAGYHWSYGNYVVIDHGNGLSTLYAHQSALFVSPGQTVSAGQHIGNVGSTGSSTGAHLHFEVRINGSTTDPAPYLGI